MRTRTVIAFLSFGINNKISHLMVFVCAAPSDAHVYSNIWELNGV